MATATTTTSAATSSSGVTATVPANGPSPSSRPSATTSPSNPPPSTRGFTFQDGVYCQSGQPESSLNLPRRRSGIQAALSSGAMQVAAQLAGRSRLVPPQSSGCTARVAESARSQQRQTGGRNHCSQEVAGGMDVHLVSDEAIEQHPVEDLTALLARDDGLVWVDIPVCDA